MTEPLSKMERKQPCVRRPSPPASQHDTAQMAALTQTRSSSKKTSQSHSRHRSSARAAKICIVTLAILSLSATGAQGQLAHNQVIPPGQKRPDLTLADNSATSIASSSKQKAKQRKASKSSGSGKQVHPTFDSSKVYLTKPTSYHQHQDGPPVSQTVSASGHATLDSASYDWETPTGPHRVPASTWRPRPQSHSSPQKGKTAAKMPEPPKAFAYLEDIGIAPKIPFVSGMRPAGQSWIDAGLRPNVDPRLKNPYRSKSEKETDRQSSFSADPVHNVVMPPGSLGSDSGNGPNGANPATAPKWQLRPERPESVQSDDADAAAIADEWDATEHGSNAASHDVWRPNEGSSDPPSKAGLAAAAASAAGYDTSPSLSKLTSQVLGSGKHVWKWIKNGGKEREGIALTMLQPKVPRPVLARVPLIPNDAKRDLVFLIIATLAGLFTIVLLWNSRVSQEDFHKLKRMREHAALSPPLRAAYGDDAYDTAAGMSSSSRMQSAGRRRTTLSMAHRRPGSEDVGLASEESDSDAVRAVTTRAHTRRNRRYSPPVNNREGRGKSRGGLRSWFALPSWFQKKGPDSDSNIALPLLSDLSRSSTPHHAMSDGASRTSGDDLRRSFPSMSRASSSSWLPSLGGVFAETAASLPPATGSSGQASGGSGGSGFFKKSPFRSMTPQPQTQRQKERERSRERRRKAEAARWETEQHVRGLATSSSAGEGEMSDFEYFTTRRSGDDTAEIDAIESGLPSRAASANSFRSWRGSLGGGRGGSMSSEPSAAAAAAAAAGVPSLSGIRPLTSLEMTQRPSAGIINSDAPYGDGSANPVQDSSAFGSVYLGASSLPTVHDQATGVAVAASSSSQFLSPPSAGSTATTASDDGGVDSGGSTPRAGNSLRRPVYKANSSNVETVPTLADTSGGAAPTEEGVAVQGMGKGKQRAL